jgi:arsenite-transporting ATPase
VVERLFEATPPGLDELVALSELTDLTASPDEGDDRRLVIVDTAPTGHALRLLELPEIALTWDHALLSILLEYRDAVGLPEGLARELVDLSKSLKRLRALLTDPERSGFAVVTRAGELPLRETRRLLASLDSLGTAVPAVIVNAVPDGDCARCRRRPEPAAEPGWPAILTAPAEYPPPRGPRALEAWALRWRRRERA